LKQVDNQTVITFLVIALQQGIPVNLTFVANGKPKKFEASVDPESKDMFFSALGKKWPMPRRKQMGHLSPLSSCQFVDSVLRHTDYGLYQLRTEQIKYLK
jgi:hypothetical protein